MTRDTKKSMLRSCEKRKIDASHRGGVLCCLLRR